MPNSHQRRPAANENPVGSHGKADEAVQERRNGNAEINQRNTLPGKPESHASSSQAGERHVESRCGKKRERGGVTEPQGK